MRTACPPGSSDRTAFRGLNCAEERSSAQFLRPRSRFRADFPPRRAVSGPPLRPNGANVNSKCEKNIKKYNQASRANSSRHSANTISEVFQPNISRE